MSDGLKVEEYIRTTFGKIEKVTCTKIENIKKDIKHNKYNKKQYKEELEYYKMLDKLKIGEYVKTDLGEITKVGYHEIEGAVLGDYNNIGNKLKQNEKTIYSEKYLEENVKGKIIKHSKNINDLL